MVTRTRSRATSLIASIAIVVLLVTACSDDSGDSGDDTAGTSTTAPAAGEATTTTVADAGPPSEAPAANLLSDLTALLEEQVYLTGFVVEQTVAAGGDAESRRVSEATDAAGESAFELSEVFGAAYGVAAGTDFLTAWNEHRQALVDTGEDAGSPAAAGTTRDAVVSTLEAMDEDADFSAVAGGLEAGDDRLLDTIGELVGGVPDAAVDLRAAAGEMPEVALELATIIAERRATEGTVDADESLVRADMTGLLQESALLTGFALVEVVQADGDSAAPGPAGLFAAVEENTEALAELMAGGDADLAASFADLWGGHIESFAAYASARIEGDATALDAAEDALVAFRDDLGALLAEAYPALVEESVAEELVPHTDAILAYADALVGQLEQTSPEEVTSPQLLREAAAAMRLAARTLTGGVTAPTADA